MFVAKCLFPPFRFYLFSLARLNKADSAVIAEVMPSSQLRLCYHLSWDYAIISAKIMQWSQLKLGHHLNWECAKPQLTGTQLYCDVIKGCMPDSVDKKKLNVSYHITLCCGRNTGFSKTKSHIKRKATLIKRLRFPYSWQRLCKTDWWNQQLTDKLNRQTSFTDDLLCLWLTNRWIQRNSPGLRYPDKV